MFAALSRLGPWLLDLAIPPRCASCGERDTWLCSGCQASLMRLPDEHCARCAAPGTPTTICGRCYRDPPPFDELRAPLLHDGLARELVLALKYRGQQHLAPPLALLAAAVAPGEVSVVVPVPLHRMRRAERGFNQAELLARGIAAELGLSCAPAALERERETPPQTGLSQRDRDANVRGAFRAIGDPPSDRILLVDDVCTTGATLAACARALRAAGAARVAALSVTRAAILA